MAIQFAVLLRDPRLSLEHLVFAATHRDAATQAMVYWLESGAYDADKLPVDVVTKTTFIEPHAARFEIAAAPPFLLDHVRHCRHCGCSDEDACTPPCSWVSDDVCSNPSCSSAEARR